MHPFVGNLPIPINVFGEIGRFFAECGFHLETCKWSTYFAPFEIGKCRERERERSRFSKWKRRSNLKRVPPKRRPPLFLGQRVEKDVAIATDDVLAIAPTLPPFGVSREREKPRVRISPSQSTKTPLSTRFFGSFHHCEKGGQSTNLSHKSVCLKGERRLTVRVYCSILHWARCVEWG